MPARNCTAVITTANMITIDGILMIGPSPILSSFPVHSYQLDNLEMA